MPRVDNSPPVVFAPELPRAIKSEFSFGEVLGAGFRQENDVVAATRLLTRPAFPPDPEFDNTEALETSAHFLNYPEELGRAQSQSEFDFITRKIDKELEDRNILLSAGAGGMVAAMTAGVLSPTMFVPLSFGAKGIKGVSQAFALAAAAAGVQEAVLFAQQETRTKEEFAFGVGAATVLGGLLGGAVAYMPRAAFKGVVDDMAMARGGETISYAAGEGATIARRAREISPPDLPAPKIPDYVAGTSKAGDNITIYAADGASSMAKIEEISPSGSVIVRNSAEETVLLGGEFGPINPRSPDMRIETLEGSPVVSTLSDDTLVAVELRLTEKIDALANTTQDVGALKRERAATQFEAQRRVAAAKEEAPIALEPAAAARTIDETGVVRADEPITPTQVVRKATPLEQVARKADDLPPEVTVRDDGSFGLKSAGAAQSRYHTPVALKTANPVFGWVNEKLALLNPVTRQITQKVSDESSYWMARLSDAGLRTQANVEGLAHALDGTVEARRGAHEKAIGQFVQEYDDAFSRHVLGDVKSADVLQSANKAQLMSAFGKTPEGKLSADEFGDLVYSLGQTGETSVDANVNKAIAAHRKLFDYFEGAAEEAYQVRVDIDGSDARRLFDPEGNLGPDIVNYITHVYDTDAVVRQSAKFKNLLKDNAAANANSTYQKRWTTWRKRDGEMEAGLGDMALNPKSNTALNTELKAEVTRLETDPAYVAYRDELAASRAARDAADAVDKPTLAARVDDVMAGRSEAIRAIEEQRILINRRIKRNEAFSVQTKAKRDSAIKSLEKQRNKLEDDFDVRARKNGATGAIIAGKADFDEYAVDVSEELYNSIVGLGTRVSGMEILGGLRGPELARTLNLPFELKKEFLIRDPEQLGRIYSRHMSADIEMYRATGSVNGAKIISDVEYEFRIKRQQLEAATQETIKGKEVPFTEARKAKALDSLVRAEKASLNDLTVVIRRLRHQRGLPENPDGMGYRLGRAAADMNVYRMMGTVVLSSIPDVGRPVMKMGLMRTFKDGWLPLVSDMKRVQMSRKVARELSISWDPVMHSRMQEVVEMWDDYASRKTHLERGIGFLANKTGFVAGFDRWTAEMKYITTSVVISQASEALRIMAKGGTAKQLRQSAEFLAANGIEAPMAAKIWKQFESTGGSTKFDGDVYLPNMEKWTDYESMAAYRQMIKKVTDDTIVTPGVDKPNWTDANMAFKLLAQFRSFTFASTNRVVMAGLQEADMAVVNGMMVSLAMGAVSYYLWAVAVGGDALEEAMKLDPDKWADEAITRSGLLGIFAEPQRAMERIPAFQNYVTFSDQRTTSRRASSLMGTTLGPTFDLGERVSNLIMGLDEPTDSTLHQARLLWPYQNVFWMRKHLFDRIEDNLGESLPDKRGE